jgi:predicted ribonuclease YlaK
MMKDIKLYDTCSLLLAGEKLFDAGEKFLVSSVTFSELEHIKTASNKDQEVKYAARLLLHLFDKHPDMYEVIVHKIDYEQAISKKNIEITNDTKILSDAIYANDSLYPDEVVFVTNDLALKHIANLFFGNGMIETVEEEWDDYTGYKEVIASNEMLAKFYEDPGRNHFNLLIGEYLILKNQEGEVVDLRKWSGEAHDFLNTRPFDSGWFGSIKPLEGDIYQKLLFDSLRSNKITMAKGRAGTGKTLISLAYLMSLLEKHKIDKIVVFCNTIATAGAAKLGYYPGSRDEKLLDSQIGNLLSSKLGGKDGVQSLINQEKLVLLPASDVRGYDTSGMNAGIYISEAQNLDRPLMKLLLQRVGEDSICIIDGDERAQVDLPQFQGSNNGMRRASKIFRGHDIYGEVTLQNIHRSAIAQIAESI